MIRVWVEMGVGNGKISREIKRYGRKQNGEARLLRRRRWSMAAGIEQPNEKLDLPLYDSRKAARNGTGRPAYRVSR